MGSLLQSFTGPGTFTVAIDASNGQANLSKIDVEVDTTAGAVTLVLPKIADIGLAAEIVQVSVMDKAGTSVDNPITIECHEDDLINNAASVVLDTEKGIMNIEVGDETNWGADLDNSSSPKIIAGFYQTVADVTGTIAANNGKVLFESAFAGNTTGAFTMVAGSGDITCNNSGKYVVDFQVAGAEANAFGIFVDGVLATGSVSGSGAVTQQNNGSAVLNLTAGDVVSLRTVDCAAVITLQLAGTTNEAQKVASITFRR